MTLAIRNQRTRLGLKDADREQKEQEMSKSLEERVQQFQLLELPGQPQGMHMGTSYLVNDLSAELKRLRADKAELVAVLEETRNACAACFRVINGKADILDDLEDEFATAGVQGGFGKRADAALAKAKEKP